MLTNRTKISGYKAAPSRLALVLLFLLLSMFIKGNGINLEPGLLLDAQKDADYSQDVSCSSYKTSSTGYSETDIQEMQTNGCLVDQCKRVVRDGLFDENEVSALLDIARKGISTRQDVGGPTIVDINSGHIRDTNGLDNLFDESSNFNYSEDEFAQYGSIIKKLKAIIEMTFNVSNLFFTAPTFITKLDGRKGWEAQGIHDEYWHPHADRENTAHYHYSGWVSFIL